MRYFLVIGMFVITASSALAQNGCSMNHPIFRFRDAGKPKVIRSLGSSPEFPFLQNLSSAKQVLAAIQNADKQNGTAAHELNGILVSIGFNRGIKDVKVSSITPVTIPSGTRGNLGDGNYNAAYSVLISKQGFKAWKITSHGGCYIYFMSRCGNAFAVNDMNFRKGASSITVPVTITSETKTITTDTAAKRIAETRSYIYYHKKAKGEKVEGSGIPDDNPSDPLLLRSVRKAEFVPQNYRVSASATNDKVTVKRGKRLDIPANINVEQASGAGNFPDKTTSNYNQVTKRIYKKSMRKMRRANRIEDRVAEMTGVRVNK